MKRGEEGYALVAAVASIAVFAAMALSIMTATRAASVTVAAEMGQARAGAAAEAGVALAMHGLLSADDAGRWPIDGRVHLLRFGTASLSVRVADERGKVPLNLLDEETATRLLEVAGRSGEGLLIARDSLLDWTDDDDETRPHGAEAAFYAARGVAPRNGPLRSIGELGRVRGFDPALVERIRPLVTVNFGQAGFDPRHAHPLAVEVMQGAAGAVDAIQRRREQDGDRTAIDLTDETPLVGRPLGITVVATLPDGARARRDVVVELTGSSLRPYTVRSYD